MMRPLWHFVKMDHLMLHRFDSEKRFDNKEAVPYIYSVKDEQSAVINVLPIQVKGQRVPLGINIPAKGAGELRLNVSGLENFEPNLMVYLEDGVTGDKLDLRTTSEYTFTAQQGSVEDRFALYFDVSISTGIDTPVRNDGISIHAYYRDNQLMVFENLLEHTRAGKVSIELVSINGVSQLVNEYGASGWHTIPANLASGTYLVKISAKNSEPHVVKVVIR